MKFILLCLMPLILMICFVIRLNSVYDEPINTIYTLELHYLDGGCDTFIYSGREISNFRISTYYGSYSLIDNGSTVKQGVDRYKILKKIKTK